MKIKEENAQQILTKQVEYQNFFVSGTDEKRFKSMVEANDDVVSYVGAHADWAASVLNLKPGQRAVVANGKVS